VVTAIEERPSRSRTSAARISANTWPASLCRSICRVMSQSLGNAETAYVRLPGCVGSSSAFAARWRRELARAGRGQARRGAGLLRSRTPVMTPVSQSSVSAQRSASLTLAREPCVIGSP
jgi:hypothetical protein